MISFVLGDIMTKIWICSYANGCIPRRLDLKTSIITMFALVFLIGICGFINYQREPVKAVNVPMSIEPFEIQDALWKALISGQSNRKFHISSYFKKALNYVDAHSDEKDVELYFDNLAIKEIVQNVNAEKATAEDLKYGTYMKKIQEAYVKRVIEVFQLKPEDLDTTPEYFCGVFGFCKFQTRPLN